MTAALASALPAAPVNTGQQQAAPLAVNTAKEQPSALPPSDNAERKLSRPPICTLSGEVTAERVNGVRLEQEPGALLRVLGDRAAERVEAGQTLPAGPYALTTLNDMLQIALAGETLTPGPLPTARANAMLQAMAAFDPQDELEGMIAMQATALHYATMDSIRRGLAAPNDAVRQSSLGQANKCSRTFAALIETLNRHRGKTTTQRVIVENVNVAPGGQAVVGAVTTTGGGAGVRAKGGAQPHAATEQAEYCDGAERAPMRRENPPRRPLLVASGEGQEALPDARRRGGERSAEGKPEPMGSRSPERRGNRGAEDAARAAAERARADDVRADG